MSIVRLAGGTLNRLDGWQVPGLTGKDLDFNASPTLFMSGTTPMVGACNKNGVFYALKQANLSAGPVSPGWSRRLGIPPASGSLAFCGGSAVYDGSFLYVGADAMTSTSPPGSLYKLDPANGHVLRSITLDTGAVVGSPSLDGAGLLAVPTFNHSTSTGAVYLIDRTDLSIKRTIGYPRGPIFAQPVFAAGELLVAGPSLQAFVP